MTVKLSALIGGITTFLLLTGVRAQEVALPDAVWKKLDTFEAGRLAKADQTFARKEYRQAITDYDAFMVEFPKSTATAYVLFRKARCYHLDEKRFKAVEAYGEVLDYFPNHAEFAAPALFNIGECHFQNGDVDKAMKAWLEMATDEDYRKHALAAHAIYSLADNLAKQEKWSEAEKYFEQVALDFRIRNPTRANAAMQRVIEYYVRLNPGNEKLQEFYKQAGAFEERPWKFAPDADIALNRDYWTFLWNRVGQEARAFTAEQEELKRRFYRYWFGQFDGKFSDWEDFQIQTAQLLLGATADEEPWVKRMDAIFLRGYKEGDYGRIYRWIEYYKNRKDKIAEYCKKIDYKKLKIPDVCHLVRLIAKCGHPPLAKSVFNEMYETLSFDTMESRDVIALMFTIFDALNDIPMGQNMLSKVKLYKMSDDEKAKLMKDLAKLYGLGVKLISRQFDDKERGMNELLEFYYGLGNKMKAGPALAMEVSEVKADRMEVASALTGVERYAASAWWKKAEFLFWDGKFQEALVCYQTADNPPENLWKIVECFKAMGRIDPAVGQLREIENFFKSLAPRAALAIAYVYRGAGRKAEEVSAFRAVMKKYRASGESSRAHQELESMGYKIGGGQDAE